MTSEVKFTPGPWRVDFEDDDFPVIGRPTWECRRRGIKGDWEIAKVEDLWEAHDDERVANCRLISSAPDLYSTARKLSAEVGGMKAFETDIRNAIGNTNWSILMQRLEECDAAISKATA